MMTFDPIPDPFARAAETSPKDLGRDEEQRVEPDEPLGERARDGEEAMTRALAVLKRKGRRVLEGAEAVVAPSRLVVTAAFVFGVGALIVYAAVRSRRPRRRVTVGRAIARSLGREIAGRLLVGAAATVGARLADAVLVPLIAERLSARALATEEAPARARKRRERSTEERVHAHAERSSR